MVKRDASQMSISLDYTVGLS